MKHLFENRLGYNDYLAITGGSEAKHKLMRSTIMKEIFVKDFE